VTSFCHALARHEPGDQHQRRALWPSMRETRSYIQNRAAQPLRGRLGTVSVI
jgi:hypothetical protein